MKPGWSAPGRCLAEDAVRLVVPALGGLLYAASGLQLVVWLNVLSFLLSALLIAGVRVSAAGAGPLLQQEGGNWRLGWRRVWRSPTLRVLLLADVLSSVKEGTYNMLGVVFVVEVLHAGATGRGLIGSAQALGGTVGGLPVGYFGAR